jgi:bifunctional UDP-N-acetylglucosamine pyrophosphorylase / glucosamine-1-phosphate N-acetyltransferase
VNNVGSLVMAAGRGSRMKGFEGNKTLLPLVPADSPFRGTRPILVHILSNLPPGPKALVVNYRKEDVVEATRSFHLTYCDQAVLNGTGGALLAAAPFIERAQCDHMIITMGDVPLVERQTYLHLVQTLSSSPLAVLGFRPRDKKQYGALDIHDNTVKRIIEWKYWHHLPEKSQALLSIFNSGIYAGRREDLLRYIPVLRSRPHKVTKVRYGQLVELEEFFVTDLVEYMEADGLHVGYVLAGDEEEVMGVDDLDSLRRTQEVYRRLTQ